MRHECNLLRSPLRIDRAISLRACNDAGRQAKLFQSAAGRIPCREAILPYSPPPSIMTLSFHKVKSLYASYQFTWRATVVLLL